MIINYSCKVCEYKQSKEMYDTIKVCCIDCIHSRKAGYRIVFGETKKVRFRFCKLHHMDVDNCDSCSDFERHAAKR